MINLKYTDLQREEYNQEKSKLNKRRKDNYYPEYHIAPDIGWLNDPNGLHQNGQTYHIYYQYAPFDINGKYHKMWGHVSTPNFIDFIHHEPFILNDNRLDAHGAYSGSAYVLGNGEVEFYYTGNYKHEGDFDFVNEGREQNVIKVTSNDSNIAGSKEKIMVNSDYPEEMTNHVRDPKVFAVNNQRYMILGARDKNDEGLALLYKEESKDNWKLVQKIKTPNKFGYMWECPDFVFLEGKEILICCPQGIPTDGYKYENVHQCGYFDINYNFTTNDYLLGDFKQLDYGFDFYAPQTFKDKTGRVILIAWLGIPEADYHNFEDKLDWQHMLTIPRELVVKEDKVLQKPLEEIYQLRGGELNPQTLNTNCYNFVSDDVPEKFKLEFGEDIYLKYEEKLLTLNLSGDESGRGQRHLEIEDIKNIEIFCDNSALEIFINEGEYSMTTHFYPKDVYLRVEGITKYNLYKMNPIKMEEENK